MRSRIPSLLLAVGLVAWVGLLDVSAQSGDVSALPSFDVASVKKSPDSDPYTYSGRLTGNRYYANNVTVRWLIENAYELDKKYGRQGATFSAFGLLGGDKNVMTARFNVIGTVADGKTANYPEVRLMLRRLLADRFKLKLHTEVRPMHVYSLMVLREGKLGPDLLRSPHDCAAFRAAGGTIREGSQPRDSQNQPLCWNPATYPPDPITVRGAGKLVKLAEDLQMSTALPVRDATGLTDNFEWNVTFARPGLESDLPAAPPVVDAVRQQLGLKLQEGNTPIEVFVVDSVALPQPD